MRAVFSAIYNTMLNLNPIEEKVHAIAEPIVCDLGLELVAVVYLVEDGRQILRLLIGRPGDGTLGGVTVGECTKISRELSTLLDVEDIVPERYSLEVSSPGLDRPLMRKKDFLSAIGKKINLKTKEPIEGRRNFKVTLEAASEDSDNIVVKDSEDRSYEIEYLNIDKARLEIEL